MDQAAKDRIRREIEDAANKLLPGGIRRIEWLEYGDDPQIEPGELLPRFVLPEPPAGQLPAGRPPAGQLSAGRQGGEPELRGVIKAFQDAHGPAIKKFLDQAYRRWPEIRHVGIAFEDGDGHGRGGRVLELGPTPGQRQLTPVMVRLKPAELDIVDTLIAAGIANNRAEVIRWVLTRIGERPAYDQLRQHIRDISRLTSEL